LHSNTSKHCQTISGAQKVIESIGDLALETTRKLGTIGNNVTIKPGYVLATNLKPGYLRSTQVTT